MTLKIELSEDEARVLEKKAQGLGKTAEELAATAVRGLLSDSLESNSGAGMDIDAAIEFVVRKNRELYKRLA